MSTKIIVVQELSAVAPLRVQILWNGFGPQMDVLQLKQKILAHAHGKGRNQLTLEQVKIMHESVFLDDSLLVGPLMQHDATILLYCVLEDRPSSSMDHSYLYPLAPSFTAASSSSHTSFPILDPNSERAALALFSQNNNGITLSPEKQAHLAAILSTLTIGTASVPPSAFIQTPHRAIPRPAGPAVRLFDPALLARLVIGFFLFANGSSSRRMIIFFCIGLAYYLYEVGLASLILKRLLSARPENAENHVNNNNIPNAAPQRPNPNAPPRDSLFELLVSNLCIMRDPGILQDGWALVQSLVCSLFPYWTVQPPPIAPGPPGAAPVQPQQAPLMA